MHQLPLRSLRLIGTVGASAALALGVGAATASAKSHPDQHPHGGAPGTGVGGRQKTETSAAPALRDRVFATGGALTNPDDITRLGGRIFVVWQNATQPDGSGGGTSTVVAYLNNGKPAGSWEISGHVDGFTADPANHRVIATANEDANSSLYTITPYGPAADQFHHYTYSPDPSTLTGGGTDAISIVADKILISASNPQTSTGPAVFQVSIPAGGTIATLTPYFEDDSPAIDAITGNPVTLNLTDPDSNAVVPRNASMFGGDFVLDSQGDSELIFAADNGSSAPSLTVLNLNAGPGSTAPQVDDVRWATSPHGTLFVTDGKANTVYAITGSFGADAVLTAIPSGSPSLAGDIGRIDLATGTVTPIATGFQSPKGLLYLPGHAGRGSAARGHDS